MSSRSPLLFYLLFAFACGTGPSTKQSQTVIDTGLGITAKQADQYPEKRITDAGPADDGGSSVGDARQNVENVLSWIEDDYSEARRQAEQREVAIVIDIWARWCRPCLLMQRFVFSDGSMAEFNSRFVWLSIDADNVDANAEVIESLPIETLPVYFIVDPLDGSVLAVHQGVASVPQFRAFLENGEQKFRNTFEAEQ